MKKLVVVAAIFASVLAINSHSLMAQTADLRVKADQELANENAALRKQIQRLELQNAELRSRIHATEKKPVVASTNADGTGRGIPATSALAADLPRKSPPHLPVPAPVYSWTGFYIGGNAGYDWSNSKVDSVASGQAIAIDPFGFGARLASEIASGLNQSIKADPHGFIGGGQIGYNWQFAPQWIVGIEADISGSSIKGSDSKASGFGGTGFPFVSQIGFSGSTTISAQEKVDWLGTLRGRLGFTPVDRLLVYGTGGLAYGHVNASAAITQSIITFNFPAVGFNTTFTSGSSASVSETRVGWAAGLGLEHGLAGNWTVKAEWLHWDLGSSTYGSTVSFSNVPLVAGGTVTTTSTAHFRGDIARAGVNYRFY